MNEFIPILTNKEYKWFKSIIGQKCIGINLLYNPCKEIDRIDVFYDCCGHQLNLYSIIETKAGSKFGGFTYSGRKPVSSSDLKKGMSK